MSRIEAIEEEIDNLRYENAEIVNKMHNLCDECPSIEVRYEIEEYCGFMSQRPVPFCPVDFECGVPGCERCDEYETLEEACEAILKEIAVLKNFDAQAFDTEVA
jgi:hypothetical protein